MDSRDKMIMQHSIKTGKHTKIKSVFTLWCLLFLSPLLVAAQQSGDANFTVGVAGTPPFVAGANNSEGISVEIWQELAGDLDLDYKAMAFTSVPEALKALQEGKIDAVVGPVSITAERAASVKFSQPYFQSSLSIMSRVDDPSLWDRIKPFFNTKFFIAVCSFVIILAIVGLLFWLAERKQNTEEFSAEPLKGIGDGMWCAIVTMTTTGYGDIAPRTLLGRIIAGCWMVICIVFAASMVAGISSTLTLTGMGSSTINTADEIAGKNVAVVSASPAEKFAMQHKAMIVKIDSLQQGYTLLKENKVAAVVYDRIQLRYYLKQHPDDGVTVSISKYAPQGYGFVWSGQGEMVEKLNVAILEMQESGQIRAIVDNWLGE